MRSTSDRDSVAGAVGLPIGIVGAVLAIVPPIAFYIAWVPGAIALLLGTWGLTRTRAGSARGLSIATVAVAGASFLITGVWLLLGWLISTVFAECVQNC